MDTITRVPAWDDLTTAEQFRYAGNLDPWAGPVDPAAQARELARFHARQNPRDLRADTVGSPCGCHAADCDACRGSKPTKGQPRLWSLRQDAMLELAKIDWHRRTAK